ncbi:NAD(P)-dependent oxidoreductase [Shinella pollutisoli]|uniref:NAD(P)-dependent oxidoreductase n=1 Tax=Shinella pollutisoli TaxID=2250594 RepID=A0ABV7DGT9_9HYPH|nr:NAD(P)-dependent oxidoreductase [Shinella pollutisoli]
MNTMRPNEKVALYGLGNMGFPIARRIAGAFPLQVADLNRDMVDRAVAEFSAVAIGSPEELAETRIVVLSLPSPAASAGVLKQIAPHLPRGSVVVETSTVNPADIAAASRLLLPHGIALVDASVMAGVSQMETGTAMLLIGGEEEHIEAVRPVLNAISDRLITFGPLGTGAAAKVINNAVAHAVMVVVAEAGAMATATGVDIQKLVGLLSDVQMGLHRPLTFRYAQRILKGDYAGGMPLDAARKDSVLALALAQDCGVPLFAIQASQTVYDIAAASGYGREDYAAIAKIWSDWGVPACPAASG